MALDTVPKGVPLGTCVQPVRDAQGRTVIERTVIERTVVTRSFSLLSGRDVEPPHVSKAERLENALRCLRDRSPGSDTAGQHRPWTEESRTQATAKQKEAALQAALEELRLQKVDRLAQQAEAMAQKRARLRSEMRREQTKGDGAAGGTVATAAAEPLTAVPAQDVERRYDPNDPDAGPFSKAEFASFYGDTAVWDAASTDRGTSREKARRLGQQPAVSAVHPELNGRTDASVRAARQSMPDGELQAWLDEMRHELTLQAELATQQRARMRSEIRREHRAEQTATTFAAGAAPEGGDTTTGERRRRHRRRERLSPSQCVRAPAELAGAQSDDDMRQGSTGCSPSANSGKRRRRKASPLKDSDAARREHETMCTHGLQAMRSSLERSERAEVEEAVATERPSKSLPERQTSRRCGNPPIPFEQSSEPLDAFGQVNVHISEAGMISLAVCDASGIERHWLPMPAAKERPNGTFGKAARRVAGGVAFAAKPKKRLSREFGFGIVMASEEDDAGDDTDFLRRLSVRQGALRSELRCGCDPPWAARAAWLRRFDEAAVFATRSPAPWSDGRASACMPIGETLADQVRQGLARVGTVGRLTMGRLTGRRSGRPSEHAKSHRVVQASGSATKWAAVELISRLIILSIPGLGYFCAFLLFVAVGPSYETLGTCIAASSAQIGCYSLLAVPYTSFSGRNVGWVWLPFYLVLLPAKCVDNVRAFDAHDSAGDVFGHMSQPFSGSNTVFGTSFVPVMCFWFYLLGGFGHCERGLDERVRRQRRRVECLFAVAAMCYMLVFATFYVYMKADLALLRMEPGFRRSWLRPIVTQGCKSIVVTLLRLQVTLWPVHEDKEKWVRYTACAAAPFQLAAVTGCNSWAELYSSLATDWAVCLVRGACVSLLDRLEMRHEQRASHGVDFLRKVSAANVSRLRKTLRFFLAPATPLTWPGDWQGRSVWRRFVGISDLAATTGTAIGCLAGCAVTQQIRADAVALEVFTPEGTTSLLFMGIFAGSELLQDVFVYGTLIDERCVPRRWRILSPEMRRRLKATVYPPLLSSRESFLEFAVPVWAAVGWLTWFIMLPVDNAAYVHNVTDTSHNDFFENIFEGRFR